MTEVKELVQFGQNLILKYEGIVKKNSYERRTYELVDDIEAYLELYPENL